LACMNVFLPHSLPLYLLRRAVCWSPFLKGEGMAAPFWGLKAEPFGFGKKSPRSVWWVVFFAQNLAPPGDSLFLPLKRNQHTPALYTNKKNVRYEIRHQSAAKRQNETAPPLIAE